MDARVLLVEPNRIMRQGLRSELAADGAVVVDEVSTGAEAIAASARHLPDVVLLDSELPDRRGPEVCSAILATHPAAAIIVLARRGDEAAIGWALKSGARAYLYKDADDLDLAGTIERALAGEYMTAARVAGETEDPRLSTQELNVVRLVAEGLTNPEIGAQLHLSRHTVKEYLSHAMRKLEASNRIEAVRKATELGLVAGVRPMDSAEPVTHSETLVYNETGAAVRPSELKVPPLKIDKLEPASPEVSPDT